MSNRKVRLDGSMLVAALACGFVALRADAEAPPQAQATQVEAEAATAHLEVEQVLRGIIESRGDLNRSIQSSDFVSLRRQMVDINERLRAWRRTADRALLIGAWRSPERKQAGASVIGRAEGAEILALMSMAIVTGYEYPAKKVPLSFIDATDRFYNELEQLSQQVSSLNRKVG